MDKKPIDKYPPYFGSNLDYIGAIISTIGGGISVVGMGIAVEQDRTEGIKSGRVVPL